MPHQCWPSAILHADADCFYAACETVKDPTLKERPLIVTSSVGGITLAKSYEAKALGIKTGMPEWEAIKLSKDIIIRHVDFKCYAITSEKMNLIFQEFTPCVEKFSIDESFMDISSMRGYHHKSYEQIGENLQQRVKAEIGINISVGISVNKTIAKIASDFNKPNGLKVVNCNEIKGFLRELKTQDICGIGNNRGDLLSKFNIKTAYDIYSSPPELIKRLLGKSGIELWEELHGKQIYKVNSDPKQPKGIMRSSSFEKITTSKEFLWGEIIRHCEEVTERLCEEGLLSSQVTLFLRTKDHRCIVESIRLSRPTMELKTIIANVKYLFTKVFKAGLEYRSTGVSLNNLHPVGIQQFDIFGRYKEDEKSRALEYAKKKIRHKYGDNVIRSATARITTAREEKSLNLTDIKLI